MNEKGSYGSRRPAGLTIDLPGVRKMVFLAASAFFITAMGLGFNMRSSWDAPDQLAVMNDTIPVAHLAIIKVDSLERPSRMDLSANANAAVVQQHHLVFNQRPALLIWLSLMSIMMAFAATIVPLFLHMLKRLREDQAQKGAVQWKQAGLTFLLVLVAMIGPGLIPHFWVATIMLDELDILFKWPYALNVAVSLTVLCAMTPMVLMLCISERAAALKNPINTPQEARELIDRFHLLDRMLRSCLGVLGVLVTFSLLTSGTLRIAVLDTVSLPELEIFPLEFVYAYGFLFSAFLAMIYLPIQLQLRSLGDAMWQRIEKIPEAAADTSVKEKLTLRSLPWEDMRAALAILAPILGSFLPEYVRSLLH